MGLSTSQCDRCERPTHAANLCYQCHIKQSDTALFDQ